MAHWFHRNALKATAPVNFDLKMVAMDGQALQICSELRQTRSRLLTLIADANHEVHAIETAANAYFSFLQGFLVAIDEQGGESKLRHSIRFRWTNSLLGNTPESHHDAVFELICMSYNIALWYSKHAAKLAGKDDISMDEAKEVHKCLRKAAGILANMQERYTGQLLERAKEGGDLDPKILNAYINQFTAEAQEVTIARAIELKHSPSLISALANETAKMFTSAADYLASYSESKFGKWRKYLHLKCVFYLAYAHCYAGENLLSQDKCGEAIRALQESESCYQDALKVCKEYSTMKGSSTTTAKLDQHLFFQNLRPLVKRTLEKCERENGFIYHQKIPVDPPQLEIKATYGLVKPEDFQLPPSSPLWTPVSYAAFDLSKAFPTDPATKSKAALKAEGELPPVKEAEIHQTTNEPKNTSGCVLS
uniref:BRO1 domain-containing protein n=1 Tax=Strigamia maritima TaxID=126957 RepID=T1IPS0_STRMM